MVVFFYGFSSALQLMPPARSGHAILFSTVESMDQQTFQLLFRLMVEQHQIPACCDCDELFQLCGGIPRELREFALCTRN